MENKEILDFKEHFGIDYVFCCYSERGVQQLSNIIAYRVERAQYELWREECEDLTWEEYLGFLCESEQMREKARCAVLQAQRDFPAERFDFEHAKAGEDGEKTCIVRLFEGKWAEGIVILFLFKAELEHHRRLRANREETYTLKQYMRDLRAEEELASALRRGFEDAVRKLDFRAAWQKMGYEPPEDA